MTARVGSYDAIVIGAGAAGLMCALTAGQRGRRVLLVEHTAEPGAKILISGGGRCNFTNRDCAPARFLSDNPSFCRSALARYTPTDFIALVERHGIAYHEKKLGQLFCDGSARAILAMLLAECAKGAVDLRTDVSVTEVTRSDHFRVETSAGTFAAPALVLASGGLSIPKMGATGFSHEIARRFGLRVTATAPALVPLRAAPEASLFDPALAGVSLDATATYGKARFREAILFTHRGLSGPAILQISSYWQPGDAVTLDMLPDVDAGAFLIERKRTKPRSAPQTALAEVLPARLAQAVAAAYLPAGELANMPDRTLAACGQQLKTWPFLAGASEGYAKAEVTKGGIDTRDLSSKTMQALAVPGLYAIGEAVDVTGWLGGYNFQWAWSSGWSAGMAL